MKRSSLFGVLLLLLGTVSVPSWAWVRVGFRGPRFGVVVAPGFGAYYPYDPYYYGPYAYPGYYYPYPVYPYPYYPQYPYGAYPPPPYGASPQQPAQPPQAPPPDTSRHDLTYFKQQLARVRERLDFDLSDGDITRDQRDADRRQLDQVEQEAKADAASNGGYVTGDQERELLHRIWTVTGRP